MRLQFYRPPDDANSIFVALPLNIECRQPIARIGIIGIGVGQLAIQDLGLGQTSGMMMFQGLFQHARHQTILLVLFAGGSVHRLRLGLKPATEPWTGREVGVYIE
ncbi:hypothetical protein A6A04_12095 [Paramagnetospirillum marisnigri]|uniref:Uncharacterized protein n=1 Tax=Paramagnetospirillum marisnigri TaxID=1285242 RepID=A0A178MYJ9_9PROT|nr:hypothetical protein A6A04_12095 [Paramagnetospirillum marisnigri]